MPKQARERTAGPLELLYSDIEGPLDPTVDGMRYAIAFVDDHSRFVWVYVLQRKSDATAALQKLLAEPDFRSILPTARTIQTDSDRTFKYGNFALMCLEAGIVQRFSPPYTQAMDGCVERTWRTLMETANTLRFEANLDATFWGIAIKHAALLHNIAKRRSLDGWDPL